MNSINSKNSWQALILIALMIAVIPIAISVYEIITSGKESVVFLENYGTILSIIIITFYVLLYVFLISMAVVWLIKQIKSIINLKNEQTKTELLLLKSQINPHFFFNMLNNLYGLVEKDSKKAKDLILKLSDMMRYSIYDGRKDFVPLEEEISYLNNYIELHKMRYHKTIDIKFDCQIQGNQRVMPLMFIILLENAFKHGVENSLKNAYVHLSLFAKENEIQFSVENNFDDFEERKHTGIGLSNLKRRLELVYENTHSLVFTISNDVYKAQLTLKQL